MEFYTEGIVARLAHRVKGIGYEGHISGVNKFGKQDIKILENTDLVIEKNLSGKMSSNPCISDCPRDVSKPRPNAEKRGIFPEEVEIRTDSVGSIDDWTWRL